MSNNLNNHYSKLVQILVSVTSILSLSQRVPQHHHHSFSVVSILKVEESSI